MNKKIPETFFLSRTIHDYAFYGEDYLRSLFMERIIYDHFFMERIIYDQFFMERIIYDHFFMEKIIYDPFFMERISYDHFFAKKDFTGSQFLRKGKSMIIFLYGEDNL